MKHIDPTREAIQVFINIKERVIDKLGNEEEKVGSKLRRRAREIPEMMLELGLIPTLSYCVSKAEISNVIKVTNVIVRGGSLNAIKDPEKIAYALYAYALLKYLTIIVSRVNTVEFKIEDLVEGDEKKVQNKLIGYLKALVKISTTAPLYRMLQPYVLQFKRLCEATFKSERG